MKTDKQMQYLFYALPLGLLTGSFFGDIILSLISLLFVYKVFSERLFKYFKSNISYILFFFYGILVLSSLNSEYVNYSLQNIFFYFRFILFALATWYLLENNGNFIKYFTIVIVSTFIFALLCGYYQYFFGYNFFNISAQDPNRITLLLSDKMVLGHYLSRLFPLVFGLFIFYFKLDIKKYILLSIILILTDLLVYISGERTAVGLMFINTIFLLIFLQKFKILRLITFLLSILFIVLISFFDSDIKNRNIDTTYSQMGFDADNNDIKFFTEFHESYLFTGWNIFLDNPLLGSGPDTFRKLCDYEKYSFNEYSCSTHPHNSYIQLLSEVGVVGISLVFMSALYLIFLVFKNAFTERFRGYRFLSDYQLCIILSLLITLVPIFPTLGFFNNWINGIYFLPVGFFIHSLYSKSK